MKKQKNKGQQRGDKHTTFAPLGNSLVQVMQVTVDSVLTNYRIFGVLQTLGTPFGL